MATPIDYSNIDNIVHMWVSTAGLGKIGHPNFNEGKLSENLIQSFYGKSAEDVNTQIRDFIDDLEISTKTDQDFDVVVDAITEALDKLDGKQRPKMLVEWPLILYTSMKNGALT